MVSSTKCVLAVALIASVATIANAIHCFNCDSSRDPKCGEKFDSQDRFKVDCAQIAPQRGFQQQVTQLFNRNSNATGCMKRLIDYYNGQPHIERTCFFGDIHNTALGCAPDVSQLNQRILSCDVCSNDLCNGSGALAPAAFAIVLFFALARVFA